MKRKQCIKRILGLLCLIHLFGCSSPTTPTVDTECPAPIFYREQVKLDYVSVVGSFNDWDRSESPLYDENGDRDFFRLLMLPPGEYPYRLYVDGQEVLDRTNPLEMLDANGEIASKLHVGDCTLARLSLVTVEKFADAMTIAVDVGLPNGHPPLQNLTLTVEQGLVTGPTPDPTDPSRSYFEVTNLPTGKHRIQAEAQFDTYSVMSPLHIEWSETREFNWEGSIIYQIMVDRFKDASGASLSPTGARRYHGGHLDGIRETIERGYFDDLNVDVIWLSPVHDNPEGLFLGRDGEQAEAYHGYWAKDPKRVEDRFGSEEAMDRLMSAAHARGLRVLLDVAPNHIHQEHPYAQDNEPDEWFNQPEGDCICGFTCSWAENMRTCWFDPFLPDLNWWNPRVSETMLADIDYWYQRFSLDGLRVDAVPMMPRNAIRHIRHTLNQSTSGERPFLLGETFTGEGGFNQIRYYLGPESLSGQFDFTLMWGIRSFLAGHSAGVQLESLIDQGIEAWDIPQVAMAPIMGNHDVPRIATVFNESADDAPTFEGVYDDVSELAARQTSLAWTFNIVQPGLPVLYYGDEWLTRGANDPFNRAPFPNLDDTTIQQRRHYDTVSRWNQFRRTSTALRFGELRTLTASTHSLLLERSSPEERLYYLLTKAMTSTVHRLPCAATPRMVEPIDADLQQRDATTWVIPPMTAVLFESEEPSCEF